MLDVTFVITRTESGGYAAVWDDPQLDDSIRVEAGSLAEVRERAADALGNWIAYRGAAIQVEVHFVEDLKEGPAPEFGA